MQSSYVKIHTSEEKKYFKTFASSNTLDNLYIIVKIADFDDFNHKPRGKHFFLQNSPLREKSSFRHHLDIIGR